MLLNMHFLIIYCMFSVYNLSFYFTFGRARHRGGFFFFFIKSFNSNSAKSYHCLFTVTEFDPMIWFSVPSNCMNIDLYILTALPFKRCKTWGMPPEVLF